MAINGGNIEVGVKYRVDSSGLNELKTQLTNISQMSTRDFLNFNPNLQNLDKAEAELQDIKTLVSQIRDAYDDAFDSTTGVTNVNKLSSSLDKIGIEKIHNGLSKLGPEGVRSFNSIINETTKFNFKLKEGNNFLTKMGETLTNTIKWGIASSAMNTFTGAVQQAYGYVQHLDTSLNDIRIVTDKSADEMDRFAEKANKAAQALGSSTTDYTEAALIYYQQGLSDEESQARAETTIKAANVTGQTGRQVSEELTAVWNGYKVTAEETELYVDKLAAVAASTASDLEELSTGMSKVASAANNMGVDVDQLNAQLSTIISVTRQAPETAGTALKTIYARMEDLKISGEDEYGVKLGDVSSTLDEVGVHIMDVNGDIRDLGEVIEEVGEKWYTWSEAQQSAIAQAIAGKRQYNNLLALFDNWDKYNAALETSQNATGTLQKQQDIYMESTAAHIQKLETEWEDFYDSLLDTDDINSILDALTNVLDKITKILDSIGGGKALITGLIGLLTRIPAINNVISSQIGDIINKNNNNKKNNENWVNSLKEQNKALTSGNSTIKQRQQLLDNMNKNASAMTDAQKSQGIQLVDNLRILGEQKDVLEKELEDVRNIAEASVKVRSESINETYNLGDDKEYYEENILNGADLASNSSIEVITELFEGQDEAIENVNESLKDYETKLEEVNNAKQAMEKAIEEAGSDSPEADVLNEQLKQTLETAKKELKEIRAEIDEGLEIVSPAATAEVQNLSDKLNDIETDLLDIQVEAKPLEGEIQSINKSMSSVENITQATHDRVINHLNDYKNNIAGINSQIVETTRLTQEFEDELNAAAKGEGITNLVQGVSSLVFAFQSLSNIGSVITNDDLTAFEKFSQITTALTFGLPMLKAGLSGLKTGFTEIIAPIIANIAAGRGLITANGEATAAAFYLFGAKEGEKVATEELTIALIAEKIAAIGATTAFLPLVVIIGAATVAVVALTSALIASEVAHKKEIEAIEESNNATLETIETKQEERKTYKDTADSLQNLIDKYKEGTISQKEFNEQKADLLANLDAESRAALNISDNWEEATRALSTYRANLARQNAEEARQSARLNAENALIAADKGVGKYDTSTQTFSTSNKYLQYGLKIAKKQAFSALGLSSFDIGDFIQNQTQGAYNKSLQSLDFYLQDTQTNLSDIVDESGNLQLSIDNPQAIVDFVNAVDQASQAGVKLDETITKQASEIRNSAGYADIVASAAQAKFETESAYGAESGIDYAQTLEEGQAAYDKFTSDLMTKEGYTLQEANDAWVTYLSGLDTEVSAQMIDIQTNFDSITSAFASKYQGDFEGSNFKAEADKVLQYLTDNNLTEGIRLFTPEEWETMILGDMSVEEIGKAVSEKLDQSIQDGFEGFKETAGEKEDNLQSLITEAISGSVETGDDSTYALLKSQLEELTTYYPELQDEVNTFNNESIIGTQQWIDAVYTLKDAYNDLEFDTLISNYSDDLQKLKNQIDAVGEDKLVTTEERDENGQLKTEYIEVEADPKKFTETISEIMNDDYSITVEIEGDITNDFDDLVDSMENMDSMAEKIGEDFVVSAEDITEIAAAYPGILEGYTDLGNGTIQLNEEIAKSAMNAASEAEIASTEELVNEIENTNAELELKKNHYKTIIEIAQKASDEKISAEQAATDISAELDEIDEINNRLKSDSIEDNAADVADNSAVNAGIVSDNWGQAYDNMASDAIEAAKTAIAAAEAVANNDAEALDNLSSDVSVTWSGGTKGTSSGINTSTSSYKSSSDVTDSDYWQNIIDDAQSQIDALDEQIASNEAMAVEAAARLGSSVTTNSTVGDVEDDDSSSDSSSEAETEEYLEREEDLYQEINDQLDEIEDKLSRIETIQDHTWGINYANNLQTQNDLLKEQIELLEEKKDTYESDLSNQRSELESQGFTFNESGSSITNQNEVLDDLYDEYNSMVDSYNAMTADEQDTYEDTLEAKKDAIEEIEDAIDDYNDAYDNYNDTLDSLLDAHYELIENEVNSFNASIDVQLELDDAKEEWNDFWYEVIEDVEDTDFGGKIAQSLGKLDTLIGTVGDQSSSEVATLTEHLSLLTDEVNKQIASADNGGEDSMFKDDSALSKETLETYRDDLMDAVRTAKEEIDDMMDTYLDALDEMNDKLDDHIEGWKAVGDHIEHNVELIQMVSGEKAYDAIGKQYEQLYQNNLKVLEADRMAKEEWQTLVNKYTAILSSMDSSDDRYEMYVDALDKAKDNLRDAISDLDSDLIDSFKDREEQFKNTASSISDALSKAMSGGMGMERMQNEWDLAIEDQEHYLDNVERSFNMEELDNIFSDILDSMEGRNDLQQEFLKFQDEEIDKLNQREKLTQYDIDELKARLEIKKQELALEEAQQNKSNLRLRRDSQGNYNYQYVANDDDVEDAESSILTAKKDWYELVKKRNVETAEAVMDIRSRMAQAEQDMADAVLAHDEEAWNKAYDTYTTLQDRMKEYMGDAEKSKQDFFKGTAQFFSDVENNTILPMWDTTVEHLIDQWSGGGEDSFIGSTTAAITELEAAQTEFTNDTNELLTTAGVNYNDLVDNGIDPTTEALEDLNDTNEELNEYLDEQNDLFDELENSIQDAVTAYNDLEDAAVNALEAANEAITTLAETTITAIDNINNAISTAESAVETTSSSTEASFTDSSGSPSSSTSTDTTSSTKKTSAVVEKTTYGTYGLKVNGQYKEFYSGSADTDTALEYFRNKYKSNYNVVKGYSFATGGYTGEWSQGSQNNNGRLAFLHQKELVLNEADTTNILNAVDAMRDIVGTGRNNMDFNGLADSITASARMSAGVLSQVGTGMLSAIASMVTNNNAETQNYRNMTVNADFSGVRSADAIYQALMELDNYGSQQAYSTSPEATRRY